MRRSFREAVQVAAVYVGTVIGAGFATGREIVEFFTQYGVLGLIGIIISGILFMWIGTKMMIMARRIEASSYKEFNEYLFGKMLGTVVNVMMLFVLIGVTSVMLSGAGAVFHEQLGLSYQVGVLITMLLAVLVLHFGIKGLFNVNLVVVPIMIIFSIGLAVKVILDTNHSVLGVYTHPESWKWLVSPFLYAAFNIAMAQAVLVPLAKEVKSESSLKWGGLLGGGALCLILVTSHISLSSLPNVEQFEIPMAEVMKTFLLSMHWLYILVIYGEIFTSVIGDIFGLQRQLGQIIKASNMIIILLILLIAYLISQLGYASLISFLYPIFGYVSLLLLVLLILPEKYIRSYKKK